MIKKATLELSTMVNPELQITIDGKFYNLRTRPSTKERYYTRDISEELKRLSELRGDDRSDKDEQRIDEINNILIALFVDAPAEITAKLPDEERLKLIKVVTAEIENRVDPTGGARDSAPSSIDSMESGTG